MGMRTTRLTDCKQCQLFTQVDWPISQRFHAVDKMIDDLIHEYFKSFHRVHRIGLAHQSAVLAVDAVITFRCKAELELCFEWPIEARF